MNNQKEYRELGPDDVIQAGDEILIDEWEPVRSVLIGGTLGSNDKSRIRRPITHAQGGEGESELEATGIPYFTMKRSEWDALGESGQKAMAEVVKAVVAASRQGDEPLCEQCGESSGAHHMGGQEHTFRQSGANPATGDKSTSKCSDCGREFPSYKLDARTHCPLCRSMRSEGLPPAPSLTESLDSLRRCRTQQAQELASLRAENERLKKENEAWKGALQLLSADKLADELARLRRMLEHKKAVAESVWKTHEQQFADLQSQLAAERKKRGEAERETTHWKAVADYHRTCIDHFPCSVCQHMFPESLLSEKTCGQCRADALQTRLSQAERERGEARLLLSGADSMCNRIAELVFQKDGDRDLLEAVETHLGILSGEISALHADRETLKARVAELEKALKSVAKQLICPARNTTTTSHRRDGSVIISSDVRKEVFDALGEKEGG